MDRPINNNLLPLRYYYGFTNTVIFISKCKPYVKSERPDTFKSYSTSLAISQIDNYQIQMMKKLQSYFTSLYLLSNINYGKTN